MESTSSRQQKLQGTSPLELSAIAAKVINPASDELPGAIFIENPQDSVPSNVSKDMLGRICLRHGLSSDDVHLPGPNGRLHAPSEGFTAFDRYACTPPFNQYIRKVLSFFGIAPSQLHQNGYALLNSLFIVFMEHLFRPPTPIEIKYLFNVKSWGDSPSFTFLESVRNCQVVIGSWTRLSYFKTEWIYVRCPPRFTSRWLVRR